MKNLLAEVFFLLSLLFTLVFGKARVCCRFAQRLNAG